MGKSGGDIGGDGRTRMLGLLGAGSVTIGGKRQVGLSDFGGAVAFRAGLKLSCDGASGGDMRLAIGGSLVMVDGLSDSVIFDECD